jgi:hypothetical protein
MWRAYTSARDRMRNHGIPFTLSWAEWTEVWRASGHWTERGRRKGEYQMVRLDPGRPFERGNVHIVLVDREYLLRRRRRKPKSKSAIPTASM